jgi:multiple sugar transport system substrate-binding protein
MVMDGQWRVRDIAAFQHRRKEQGLPRVEFGVCSLPIPEGSDIFSPRENAGWVNGNFFVIPSGAKNSAGAWEFMKFWIGYSDAGQAAQTCAEGGWIPVSKAVIEHEVFQDFIEENHLFAGFVELATSANQFPIPQVPGAAMFRRTVEDAAYQAMTKPDRPALEFLEIAEERIQDHLDRVILTIPSHQPPAAKIGGNR